MPILFPDDLDDEPFPEGSLAAASEDLRLAFVDLLVEVEWAVGGLVSYGLTALSRVFHRG